MNSAAELKWHELMWSRPLDPARVMGCLRQWAADQRSPHIVLEARATGRSVSYLVGTPAVAVSNVFLPLALAGATSVKLRRDRQPVKLAFSLRISTRHRALRTTDPEPAIRALLGSLIQSRDGETLVLQVVLGSRRVPLAVPNQSPSSVAMPTWQAAWQGNGGQIDGEKRSALRAKVSDHGFAVTVRIGVAAETPERRRALILGILSAVRTTETPGVKVKLARDLARRVDTGAPPLRWPLRLNVIELVALTGWPVGDDDLPGQPAAHPRRLPPAPGTTGKHRIIASATASNDTQTLALPAKAALHHTHVIGTTGTGKSTLLANLVAQDIADGRGVVVVEPKGDLIEDILKVIPRSRHDDVVILDPNDTSPVGLNPLSVHGRKPELVADGMLTIFKQLYGKAIGARSQDILYASLLTLAHHPDSSLVMLPLLLTNPGFRRSLTGGLHDRLFLEPFWAGYDAWSDAERTAAVAPVMNKLRPLMRPGLRGVLGQREPRFHIRQVLTEGKILLVPLQRGVIGADAAGLLGSLVMSELWLAIQGRAAVAPERRRPVMVVVDEVQDYLNLPTDLGDALAQARGYGAAFTLAHQYLGQLPRDMRTAVLANARSRIVFQIPHADAVVLAKGHSELSADDFAALGQYEIYASLFANGQVHPYASGRTLPPPAATSSTGGLRAHSRDRWGRSLDSVETGFLSMLDAETLTEVGLGRRRRQP